MPKITLFDITHYPPAQDRRSRQAIFSLLPSNDCLKNDCLKNDCLNKDVNQRSQATQKASLDAKLDRRIVNCLQQLDVEIQYVSKAEFLHSSLVCPAEISLFLCEKKDFTSIEFESAFARYSKTNTQKINLCLLPCDSEIANVHFLNLFNDFLYWPCSFNELQLRLKKYVFPAVVDKNTTTVKYHAEMISTFSKLNLCGESDTFMQTLERIKKIAVHQATVLIQGETGTGKENAARAIHYLGSRAQCAFVPINCATISDSLLESELFGHEKGAFTDARQAKEGLVAMANGGTLFLDEVDSLSTKAQAALLRFLQTKEYRPIGSKKILYANVRIIAATNADLKYLSTAKQYREDLYFRLNVLNLKMPPLRERIGDIAVIAESLVKRFSKEYDLPIKLLSQRSLRYLEKQYWPGNVREFENTLLSSFLFSNSAYLEVNDELYSSDKNSIVSPEESDVLNVESISVMPPCFQDAKALAIELFEKKYLSQVMLFSKGNVTAAAKIAGKERRALGKLLQKYDINKDGYRPS
jgi:DNA-binding NtrC family response regulator